MMMRIFAVAAFLLTLGMTVAAQTADVEAVMPDGKIVILKADGTWAKKELVKGKVLGVSAAAFTAIVEGMSYAEAVEIIGDPGDIVSDATTFGVRTFSLEWKPGKKGGTGTMILMFQGDKLYSKMQYGLK